MEEERKGESGLGGDRKIVNVKRVSSFFVADEKIFQEKKDDPVKETDGAGVQALKSPQRVQGQSFHLMKRCSRSTLFCGFPFFTVSQLLRCTYGRIPVES